MKLNVSEYRWILLNCNLMLGQYKGKQYAVIEPRFPKHQAKLNRLLGSVSFPSLEEWNKLSRILKPKLKEHNLLQQQNAIRKLSGMDNNKLAKLNNKQRIELLDSLLQDVLNRDTEAIQQNQRIAQSFSEQIKILFLGIILPEEFLEREWARSKQFCNQLQSTPNLKNDLEDWQITDSNQHLETIQKIIDVFNAVYHTQIKLKIFDDEREITAENKLNMTAYANGNSVYINQKQIDYCDNLAIPALIFHTALRISQRYEDWSCYPLIEKLFESKFTFPSLEDSELFNANPIELNSYKMDENIIGFLLNQMQIKFVESGFPQELNQLTHKIFEDLHATEKRESAQIEQ